MAGELDALWDEVPTQASVDRGEDAEGRIVAGGAPGWAEPVPAVLGGGRYRVGSLIGRGGSSEVFRGHDALLGRPVAIKLFPSGSAEPTGSAEPRRWREVRTVAGLNHPRVVSVFDAGTHAGRSFFVLQLVEGSSLSERLASGPLTLGQTLRLGGGLLAGLSHVHRSGVTHRDLKPANVLLDHTDRPYLTDFGIATWLGAAALTLEGLILGTPAYLAPEQVRGQPIGPAADMYALGLVLLECLTGRREYPGDPATAAPARLGRPPAIPAELPDPVAAALAAMTRPQADRRPDAAELAAHFAALLGSAAGEPAQLRPISSAAVDRPGEHGPSVSPHSTATGSRRGPSSPGSPTPTPHGAEPSRPAARPQRRRPRVTAGAASLVLLLALGSGVAAAAHGGPAPADATRSVVAAAPPVPDPMLGPTPATGPANRPGPSRESTIPARPPVGSGDREADAADRDRPATPELAVEPVVAMRSDPAPGHAAAQTQPDGSTQARDATTPEAPRGAASSGHGKTSDKSTGSTTRKSSKSPHPSKHQVADIVGVPRSAQRSTAHTAHRATEHASRAISAMLPSSDTAGESDNR
ncbi:serine/threonine protein kinase [Actinomycetospora sp.]|uniref:serine/threonine protein kinase n=1 Tax=Actinomycetospora sp. TaxID=1872135 RepID=UPI002F3FC204